jgi:Zn-dependent oligopeptidase
MRIARRTVRAVFLCAWIASTAWAQPASTSQAPLWSAKPDVTAFEKIENDHLSAAERAVERLVAAKGARTIENTVVPFDEAIQQINSANYFATLMQQVHPDAAFRDHATEMTRKASAAQTALSLHRDV